MKSGLKIAGVVLVWIVGATISLLEVSLMYAVYRQHGLWLGAVVWVQLQFQMFLYITAAFIICYFLFFIVKWIKSKVR